MSITPTRRLSFRVGAALCLGAALVLVVFGAWNLRLQRAHLTELVEARGNESAELIRSATREAMLRNDPGELQRILQTLAGQETVQRIRVYDKQGRIARSTEAGETGTQVDLAAEQCISCHGAGDPLEQLPISDRTRVFAAVNGARTLGVILPILNEAACASCHVHPASQRVLGVLDVQLSLDQVDRDIEASVRQLLLGLVLAVVCLLAVAWFTVWRLVLRPVTRLTRATSRLASGNFSEHVPVGSHDEIGAMTEAWNAMNDDLGRAQRKLEEWNHTLEQRVADKTEELKVAHGRMLLIEKMASLGKLAAVVAHELNNPLTGINTYARLLRRRIAGGELIRPKSNQLDTDAILELVETESSRCGSIVRNLLLFSRTPGARFTEEDLRPLLQRCFLLLRHKAELQEIELSLEVADDVPPVTCDASQIPQMVMALLVNAIEASPSGTTVTLSVRRSVRSDGIVLECTDRGRGIPADQLDKIFEPFFTTKDEGRGAGLGLAVVYGIVERHRGSIEVDSTVGEGTTVRVHLPRIAAGSSELSVEPLTEATG